MGPRTSLLVSTLVSVAVGILLLPRDSEANCGKPPGGGQPPSNTPNTCGIGGKDAALAGTHCDDQNKCTTSDACDGDGHCVGKPVLCPSLPCATAACNPATGACASTNRPDGTRCGPGTCKNGVCAINTTPIR